ncbi:MAG: Gfo/Idh/MocA family protein [Candidatus Poseidoniaceae archaeon]
MSRRIGVIGCGRWGSKHLQSLQTLAHEADIECIVACDLDASTLESIQYRNVELHDNPHTLVDSFQLDSVIIATPNATHYELGMEFLGKGVDVFLEKPLATTFDHASSLVSTAIQEGKILKSGFLLRFHPCILDARSQIRAGQIGAIQSIHYRKKSQRISDESSHALDTLAIHGIDLAEFLLDGQTPLRISEVHGTRTASELVLEYPNQVEIYIDVGWNEECDVAELEVIGREGRMLIQLQHHDHYEILKNQSSIEYIESKHTPLEAVILDFVNSESTSIAASTGSILRTLKCIEQAHLQLIASGRSKTRELKR